MKIFVTHHLPAILWGVAILAVSSIPNLKAPEVGLWGTDKLAHFVEYAGFAFLAGRSLLHRKRREGPVSPPWSTLGWVAGLALIDETLQAFVPGRTPDPLDYLSDLLGGLAVVGLLRLIRNRKTASKA